MEGTLREVWLELRERYAREGCPPEWFPPFRQAYFCGASALLRLAAERAASDPGASLGELLEAVRQELVQERATDA